MKRYRDRYRVETTRLRGHDYAAPGWYFVTICTKDRACFFGDVQGGVMGLSAAGCVAHRCWAGIPDHFDRARLGAFVVMPNHVHGLVGLMPRPRADGGNVDSHGGNSPGHDENVSAVETLHATSLQTVDNNRQTPENDDAPPPKNERMAAISPGAGSLAAVVRSYKSAVTRQVRRTARPDFAWQSRFYDHVVRDDRSRRRIAHYIRRNPPQWTRDRNHPRHSQHHQPPPQP